MTVSLPRVKTRRHGALQQPRAPATPAPACASPRANPLRGTAAA